MRLLVHDTILCREHTGVCVHINHALQRAHRNIDSEHSTCEKDGEGATRKEYATQYVYYRTILRFESMKINVQMYKH